MQNQAKFQNACALIQSGNIIEARSAFDEIIKSGDVWDELYSKLGITYIIEKRHEDAIRCFREAIDLNPEYIAAYNNLCLAYSEMEEFEKAAEHADTGLTKDPNNLSLLLSSSIPFRALGRLSNAIKNTKKALEIDPHNVQILNNLGALHFESGDKSEAEKYYRQSLKLQPGNAETWRMLSLVKKFSENDQDLHQMRALSENLQTNDTLKRAINFALGKAYEDAQQYEKSYQHYEQANELYRQTYQYAPVHDMQFFELLKNKEYPKNLAEPSGLTPIFIIGMPRSGTSLIEQVLASHPKNFGAGELNYLHVIHDNIQNIQNPAEEYLNRVSKLPVGQDITHFTDKMPQNFRYVGLIKALFPNAKIIHCVRDPKDTCLSIFKTFFTGHLPFAYKQQEIASYYQLYTDLMQHWEEKYPDDIHNVKYEDFVQDPENEIKNLLKYCDLEWHEQCLEFHTTKRAVTTASAMQVKEPLYTKAVNYWQNYQDFLRDEIKNLSPIS